MSRALVRDYVNRNFVTAGGWAIEKMAIALGSKNAKASAVGIDLERSDPGSGEHHLYVIKSGKVTRNSDILSALKRHARAAEKLLMQGGGRVKVFANYAIAAGQTSTTFHDGIRRPSSALFWSEVTSLPQEKAMRLAYAISKSASDKVQKETAPHIAALELLVREYIANPCNNLEVDWDFIFLRNMSDKKGNWDKDDAARHKLAWSKLLATGYKPVS